MKIKVIRQNEFNVLFDMVTDDLPAPGEYHLVPVNHEMPFVVKIILDKIGNEDINKNIEFLGAKIQNSERVGEARMRELNDKVNAVLKKMDFKQSNLEQENLLLKAKLEKAEKNERKKIK